MKSLIKKTFMVVVILAAIVDWPVKVEAGPQGVVKVAKEAAPLFRSCAKKTTVVAEKCVNKSTQNTEKIVNTTLPDKSQRLGVLRASMNAKFIICPRCHGRGRVEYNGYPYACARCKGIGRISIGK